MRTTSLLKRGLAYYWQTNLVVIVGVAIAVAVLAGALLIGASVRGSLRDLVSQRLGNTDHIVVSTGFFREQLATDVGGAPLIALEGVVEHEPSRRRAGGVRVYGVDERFWQFNGVTGIALENRQARISEALANELGSQSGDSMLLRIEKHSDIPIESLHGRKDDPGKTIRLNVSGALARESLGEFSLQPTQGAVRAIFVSLPFLQRELEQQAKVNTILLSQPSAVNEKATLEDLGLTLRRLDNGSLSLESSSNLISDSVAAAASETARALSLTTLPVFSYLANSISAGDRSVPYSLVTALDGVQLVHDDNSIVMNEWAARNLNVKPGDKISLEYYIWHEGGRLETRTADFKLTQIVPIAGLAAARDLVPHYPGITESENLADWDPPFPLDLSRVREEDEDYWRQYRTTPKAFISLAKGQELWQSRFGKYTSIRIQSPNGPLSPDVANTYRDNLRKALQPTLTALQVIPVRSQGLDASRGATDFGEYFLYFSFFLVVSALLLTALFFKLGIEQRLREIGTLQALGFAASRIRNLFLTEGLLLAIIGSLLGLLGAIGYAALLMYGLRTWWVDAVGTTSLTLHVSWQSMVFGALGGIAAATVCIFLTLRRVTRSSTRSLLTGTTDNTDQVTKGYVFVIAIAATVISLSLLLAGALNLIPQVAGFFSGGMMLLVAAICFVSAWLRKRRGATIRQPGWWAMTQLGFRNTTYRPARTVLCVALIASAAFIIVAVDAFRRSGVPPLDKKSGSGGFPFVAESLLPIVHDVNTPDGREALNLNTTNDDPVLKDLKMVSFRMRPGDDTSCLNLYQPRNPKIIAPPESFIRENRFSFQNANEENPWLLLNQEFPDGAIPVIGDANSLTYVLHLKVGDDFVIDQGPVRLRVVAALTDSIFQSELLMSEKNFLRLFPSEQGYRYFLLDTPNASEVATTLEDRLSDFGFDAQSTQERLASFHRVENTYLSTFQLLGGLGLALGTLGMAAVLLRNVLERRRELALMRAVGYNSSHFAVMVITENVLMLCLGLAVGFVCALLAIVPILFERGGKPNISLGLLLLAILLSGATASLVATIAALRSPLLPALRSE